MTERMTKEETMCMSNLGLRRLERKKGVHVMRRRDQKEQRDKAT